MAGSEEIEALQDSPIDAIPLGHAVLCVECEMVTYRTETGRCLVCGSDATLALWNVLNREVATK